MLFSKGGVSPAFSRLLRAGSAAAAAVTAMGISAPAGAQEFVHTFNNPSFGGNPFNSEHLFAIANIHRPSEPADEQPTPEEALVNQLRTSLFSSLSTEILQRIRALQVGQTGQYVVGDQTISFNRAANGTTVTFTNTRTGETSQVFIPTIQPASQSASSASLLSAEQALGAAGSSPLGASTGSQPSNSLESGLLSGQPPL